jgi:ABC-type phosphate transport system auxiliary subunit
MAHDHLPDFDELLAELVTLERRERQVSDERRRLHLRLDKFPNDLDTRREQAVSAERRELHVRIDALRAELRPVLGTPEPPAEPPRLGA